MPLSTPKARAVFAALLLHPNRWISKERVAEFVWPTPPPSVAANLRTHVVALRRALDSVSPGLSRRLRTLRGAGLLLHAHPDEVDAHRFQHLVRHGHRALRAGRPHQAAGDLTAALGLWRGPAGVDLPDTAGFRDHIHALDRQRQLARADLCEARLRLGEAPSVLLPLRELTAEAPLAERPVTLLIEALCAVGEPAEALATYERYRRHLAEETGAGPSAELQARYLEILRGGRASPDQWSWRSDWAAATAQ